ncbi:MAG TPA: transcriptional regulator [Firmicutes bacterium]|jgi:transcriptional regulator CtsR|nr:transcriptional regulator [Bacillota bacterium]
MSTLADHIEAHIKRMLRSSQTNSVELSRAQMADDFSCVPSQINYVLSTRFTLERGYIVESRRGGGGYIRVGHVQVDNSYTHAISLLQSIGSELDDKQMENILAHLKDRHVISSGELQLIRGIVQQEVGGMSQGKNVLRASLVRSLLFFIMESRS